MDAVKIMVVAGEASGDAHAAKLVRAIRKARPDGAWEFFGSAGPKMRAAGVEAVVEADQLSVVGLSEIAGALPMFLRVRRDLKRAAIERKPDVVVLVDFPDFNLKLAKALKKLGHTIVYYISPQLWAWRKYRLATVRSSVDLMLTILPFEKDWYAKHGVEHVAYVGNPLAREVHATLDREAFRQKHGLESGDPIVAFLPGSRHKEIARILPVMLETAVEMARETPNLQFVVALADQHAARHAGEMLRRSNQLPGSLKIVVGETYDLLAAAGAAAVTSGTATMEAAILNTPLVVVYKTSALNYGLLEPMISVEHYGLVNLVAGERLAKELIQGDLSPQKLKEELVRLLEPGVNQAMRTKLAEVAEKLGHGGASKRAAEEILKLLDRRSA